ncbi:MAG: hypothetical protein OHK0023_23530 [Anaerolineae bacterium]
MTNKTEIPGTITGREPRLSRQHSTHGTRRLSLRGLASMLHALPPDQISLEVAEAALRSDVFFVRYNAAVMLSKRADRDARIVMENVLKTAEAPSRASAARHLGGFSWYTAEPLLRIALADSDSRVREGAIYALCDMHELEGYRLMAEALANETDFVRSAAAWGLRECQDAAAVPALAQVLKAEDPEVRAHGLESLGANGTYEAVPLAKQALYDPASEVQYAATLTLLELIGENGLSVLIEVLPSQTDPSKAAILRGLFHASNYLGIDIASDEACPAVLEALEAAITSEAPELREAAVWVAAWMRLERAEAIWQQAYRQERNLTLKAQMLRIVVSLMANGAEELLAAEQTSEEIPVREMAVFIATTRTTVATYDTTDTARHGLSVPHLGDN